MRLPSILAALIALAACTQRQTTPGESRVSTLPAGGDIGWFTVSRDGSTAAYAERRDFEVYLIVGDRRYGPFA